MIRVVKPKQAPPILRNAKMRGPKETRKLREAYDDGEREFAFKSDVYGAKSVKDTLIQAQHGKCCFCESKILHIDYGDVEHFRPKGGYRQTPEDELTQPGYYWLAYAWANLFLGCAMCNQRYKQNLFPLANAAQRATSHHDDVSGEQPLFVDPAADDPARYIDFNEEYARAINGNPRGQATLDFLGLNREELVERRRDRLRPIKLAQQIVRLWTEGQDDDPLPPDKEALLSQWRSELETFQQESAEYAAMARAALTG